MAILCRNSLCILETVVESRKFDEATIIYDHPFLLDVSTFSICDISMEAAGAHDPRELCKYGHNRQA